MPLYQDKDDLDDTDQEEEDIDEEEDDDLIHEAIENDPRDEFDVD